MKISKIPGLGRFGVFIDDVDLMTISDEEWMEIGKLHIENLVTIIRNSNCTADRESELLLKFGEPRHGPKVYLAKKYKDRYNKDFEWVVKEALADSPLIDNDDKLTIRCFGNVAQVTSTGYMVAKVAGGVDENGIPKGMFSEGELLWHSNESGTLTFCPGVGLLGYENVVGSSTGFVTTTDYYESVSESFRSELNEMVVVHQFAPGKINPGLNAEQDTLMHFNMCPYPNTEVPLVIKSPGGITGLHYPPNTAYGIKGMSQAESKKVFETIEKGIFTEEYTYDHWYKNDGDLCLFDNTITLHRRRGWIDGRLCYRATFDYTNLQSGPYQPYSQPEYQQKYNKQIRDIVKILEIENFKLPSRTWRDFIPFRKAA
jgi:alpha-ketoglutarate-dependent taurine dioxygenase